MADWQIEQNADALRFAHAGLLQEDWAMSAPWQALVDEVILSECNKVKLKDEGGFEMGRGGLLV